MTHAVDLALLLVTISAFLYIALGLWVLTLTPLRRQTKLLGAFAIIYGLAYAPTDVLLILDVIAGPSLFQQAIQQPFLLLSSIVALGLALSVPRRLEDRRTLGLALGVGVGAVAISASYTLAVSPPSGGAEVAIWTVQTVDDGVVVSALALLGLRARPSRAPSAEDVTQLAILSVAFLTLEGFVIGQATITGVARPATTSLLGEIHLAALVLDEVLVPTGIWGWNMVRAREDTVRIHRATMLAILGLFVAGGLYQVAFPGVSPSSDNPMRGIMRTLGVGLLAYGILRHDIAGLDARVEWGVSKTTVAGVFVAVFFVAGELAETFFGAVFGPYAGVLAAGALVFAISPLQRVADRFAAKAVPGGAEAGAAEERYKDVVEMALADGAISRQEERRLGRKAAELGIAPERARELQEQVEDRESGGEAA